MFNNYIGINVTFTYVYLNFNRSCSLNYLYNPVGLLQELGASSDKGGGVIHVTMVYVWFAIIEAALTDAACTQQYSDYQ